MSTDTLDFKRNCAQRARWYDVDKSRVRGLYPTAEHESVLKFDTKAEAEAYGKGQAERLGSSNPDHLALDHVYTMLNNWTQVVPSKLNW